ALRTEQDTTRHFGVGHTLPRTRADLWHAGFGHTDARRSPSVSSKRSRRRRRSRYPMGLALGLCLISAASAVLLVSVPEPSDVVDPLRGSSPPSPVPEQVLDVDGSPLADDAAAVSPHPSPSEAEPPEEDPGNVLLRSVEEEVASA